MIARYDPQVKIISGYCLCLPVVARIFEQEAQTAHEMQDSVRERKSICCPCLSNARRGHCISRLCSACKKFIPQGGDLILGGKLWGRNGPCDIQKRVIPAQGTLVFRAVVIRAFIVEAG
jgi:hypothetical protein